MLAETPRSASQARHAVVATAAVAAALLMGTAQQARSTAGHLATTLSRGEGEGFLHALTAAHSPERGPPDLATMRAVHARYAGEGLLAVALVGRDGRLLRAAGAWSSVPLSDEEGAGGASMRAFGSRVRMFPGPPPREGPPPGASPFGAHPFEPPPGPPPGPPPEPPRGAPMVAIEFDPSAARTLAHEADLGFAVASLASLFLLAGAGWFWQWSRRVEVDELRAARNERLATLGTMSAVIAHEIRNPLASLKGHAQLLVESIDEASPARKSADRVVNGALRLERLTRDLLDFVRDGPLERAPLNPCAALRMACAEFDPPVGVACVEPMPFCVADASRLSLALSNLLRNAREASPDGVEALVRADGDGVAFVVRDRGAGIDPEALETIFEPFATKRARGVGLGLAVVRRVAEVHRGRVTARNHPDGGAEFRLWLPAVAIR